MFTMGFGKHRQQPASNDGTELQGSMFDDINSLKHFARKFGYLAGFTMKSGCSLEPPDRVFELLSELKSCDEKVLVSCVIPCQAELINCSQT